MHGGTGVGPVTGNLPHRLRVETRELHARAERAGAMGSLLRGKLDKRGYCALLRSLHPVYGALEGALERHRRHAAIRPIFRPALHRSAALAIDLSALHGSDWHSTLAAVPAVAEYVSRIESLAARDPHLLCAHAYVRFLGDLSGGQILRKLVAESIVAGAAAGLAFYAYDDSVPELAHGLRAGLEEVGQNTDWIDAITREARHGFELHIRIFSELDCADAPGQLAAKVRI